MALPVLPLTLFSPWFHQKKNVQEEGGEAVAEKCKWEMKVMDQMGSKGEESNAAGRICWWVLKGRATEPGCGEGLFSDRL